MFYTTFAMPGHIKKGSGPDPDPSPWLEVKDHIREEQKKKAYDPKRSVWVPNTNKEVGGYFEGISEEEIKYDTFSAGKKLAVNVNGEVISLLKRRSLNDDMFSPSGEDLQGRHRVPGQPCQV